jgi:hypothetical protein
MSVNNDTLGAKQTLGANCTLGAKPFQNRVETKHLST